MIPISIGPPQTMVLRVIFIGLGIDCQGVLLWADSSRGLPGLITRPTSIMMILGTRATSIETIGLRAISNSLYRTMVPRADSIGHLGTTYHPVLLRARLEQGTVWACHKSYLDCDHPWHESSLDHPAFVSERLDSDTALFVCYPVVTPDLTTGSKATLVLACAADGYREDSRPSGSELQQAHGSGDLKPRLLGPDSRNNPITANNMIGSVISRQLMISRSHRVAQRPCFNQIMILAILLAMWICVWSEISSQQLVILSAMSPLLKSTNYWETFTRTCSALC